MDPPHDLEWVGETPAASAAKIAPGKEAEQRAGRQLPCRYGRGCTHMSDAMHSTRFWHPPPPETVARLQAPTTAGYVCNECGVAFAQVRELQLHMKRKTAWSNQGLVGCRVSCLVDNREWQEGVVAQFSKTGKHCVDFRHSGERRWLVMSRTAFYIIERPPPTAAQECKEPEHDPTDGLAPLERWHVCEDLSLDFCAAQSLLHLAFGCKIQETGHKTVGHLCVTDKDRSAAREARGSLLYGELLPRGVNKAMGPSHLNAANVRTVFDLGMGTGKVAMQVYLQFANLRRVYGVELSQARYEVGERAVLALMELQPGSYTIELHEPGRRIQISTPGQGGPGRWRRVLTLECGNLFDVPDLPTADIALLETDMPPDCYAELAVFLRQMRVGAQALTYLDLRKMWDAQPFPFRQVEVNRTVADRFPTSWSVHRGHHFYLWSKSQPHVIFPTPPSSHNATAATAATAAAAAAFLSSAAGTPTAAAAAAAAAAASPAVSSRSGASAARAAAIVPGPAGMADAASGMAASSRKLAVGLPGPGQAGSARSTPSNAAVHGRRHGHSGERLAKEKPEGGSCFGGLLSFLGVRRRNSGGSSGGASGGSRRRKEGATHDVRGGGAAAAASAEPACAAPAPAADLAVGTAAQRGAGAGAGTAAQRGAGAGAGTAAH